MNHPVEFSLNLTDEIQVQFRFMRAPLANRGHFKAMEQGIYSLLLKIKMQGDGIMENNNRRIDTEEEQEIEEEELVSRTPKVIKSGYLIKRGQGNFAKWARRYVELDDNLLLKYYASDSEEDRKEPLGIVVIDSDSMVCCEMKRICVILMHSFGIHAQILMLEMTIVFLHFMT